MIRFLWILLVVYGHVNASEIPLKSGIYSDGRYNIEVRQKEDPGTFVKWFHIFVRFGRLGFYFNPRSKEASEFPFWNDPSYPFEAVAPRPYILEQSVYNHAGYYFRWKQGGLLSFTDTLIEMSLSPAGDLTSLRMISRRAALSSPVNFRKPYPRFHSGPWKLLKCYYNCENLKPEYDKSLDPKWFDAFVLDACSEALSRPASLDD